MEFAGALRQAIQASGLTLERVRHRLERSGLTVSVATLSYWQRGRSRPRSRAVVETLEDVLAVPPGTLTGLLDDSAAATGQGAGGGVLAAGPSAGPPAAASGLWPDPVRYAELVGQLDRSGDHRLERLGVHDVFRLDEARLTWTLSVRAVLRAAGDDIDRVVCVHRTGASGGGPDGDPDGASRLAAARYCRPGRIRAGGGLVAFELVFDRVLAAGDTAVVEYDLGPVTVPAPDATPDPDAPGSGGTSGEVGGGGYDRRFPQPVQQYVAVVQFDGDRLPARCYGYTAETSDGPRRRLGELWVGTSGSANLAVANVRRGIVGLEWEWH